MDIIITPYRWYDKYHKQNRFDNDCSSTCEFKLITHRSALLPFQFTRPASPYTINKWLLRPACKPFEPTLLNINDSKFISPFNWDVNGDFIFDCSVAKLGGVNMDELTLNNILTIGKKYRITFSCTDLYLNTSSAFYLSFHNSGGTAIITNINELGFYEAEFTATGTNVQFIVNSLGGFPSEYIGITDIQIFEVFVQESFDIELDETLIHTYNYGAVDYFIYCGSPLGIVLPPGEYYSIIITTNENKHFSEVITVKDFLPEKSPYYILKWENTCDINNVIYQDIDCDYFNILYLDEAVITRPDYPFKEEGEEDGNQDFNPTFQKWEKRVSLLIGKCPEFIVDALTAIRLHESFEFTNPIRKKQLVVDDAITVKSVEYEVIPVFNDCFSNVELKLLLQDKYVDSTCCNNNIITPCVECDNTFQYYGIPPEANDGEYAIVRAVGLYQYDEDLDEWILQDSPPEGSIWCATIDGTPIVLIFTVSEFQILPSISNWGTISYWFISGGGHFHIEGYAYPDSYVQVETSDDGGMTWTKDSQIVTASIFTLLGIDFPFLDDDQTIQVRVHNFTLNCDYGYSEVKSVIMVGDFNNDYSDDFFV